MRMILLAGLFVSTSVAGAIVAPVGAPDYRQIGRGRAMVTFHNGCVIDYRMGKRRSVSRYCTAPMTAAADRRAALGGALRVNGAVAAPLVIRRAGGEVQVGFAGVACNYVFTRAGRLRDANGVQCSPALLARASELQSRVPRG